MDEQLIQAAAQSFCKVPEVYQQIFKQAGQDFPDELVQQIKQQPEQAMQMLEQNQDLLKNVVTIYSQYQDQITQAMQQNSMFKEGGKFDYLIKKMQSGGPFYKVKPAGMFDWLTKWFTSGTPVSDYKGATNRSIKGYVEPNGKQTYIMDEIYGGVSPTSTITITPGDTTVRQTYSGRGGDYDKTYKRGSDEYNSVMDRFRKTGILNYTHANFPQTVKKK